MRILYGLSGLRQIAPGTVLSVGNFDGIHRGHERILAIAAELKASRQAGGLAVVTFEPHPLTVLRPGLAPPRLTPLNLKQSLLEQAGVDDLVILPPAQEVLDLSAEDFWKILREEVRPSHLVEGRSFTFGKNRGGTIERLARWSAESDVKLNIVEAVSVPLLGLQIVQVSSSLIRWLLTHGRVRDAAICLGRTYVLEGLVVKGHQRGRTIGVPTANLHCTDQLIPADGVYAGRVTLNNIIYPVAVSIGTMPTFGDNQRQIEAHLIGFDGDLYDRTIRVELVDWIREQRKFGDVERLKERLTKDLAESSRRRFLESARPIACA